MRKDRDRDRHAEEKIEIIDIVIDRQRARLGIHIEKKIYRDR